MDEKTKKPTGLELLNEAARKKKEYIDSHMPEEKKTRPSIWIDKDGNPTLLPQESGTGFLNYVFQLGQEIEVLVSSEWIAGEVTGDKHGLLFLLRAHDDDAVGSITCIDKAHLIAVAFKATAGSPLGKTGFR